jgi:hypothetical protein
MSTKSRGVIWGGQIMGAKMRAQTARQRAQQAAREADRAEAESMVRADGGYGGPAQPSPTLGRCMNGGLGWLEAGEQAMQDLGKPATGRRPATAGHADLEAGGLARVSFMPKGAICSARLHDEGKNGPGERPYKPWSRAEPTP